jgi:hypothetical protein
MVLLISASWVARIIGVSHWCPVDQERDFKNNFSTTILKKRYVILN